jgi:hypothetical protein
VRFGRSQWNVVEIFRFLPTCVRKTRQVFERKLEAPGITKRHPAVAFSVGFKQSCIGWVCRSVLLQAIESCQFNRFCVERL